MDAIWTIGPNCITVCGKSYTAIAEISRQAEPNFFVREWMRKHIMVNECIILFCYTLTHTQKGNLLATLLSP